MEHVFAIPAEGGPWAQKSAALSSPVKHSPWVACVPSVRLAISRTRGTERNLGTLPDTLDSTGDCALPPSGTDLLLEALLPFLCLWHSGPQGPQCFPGISHWASPPPGAVGWALSPSPETGAKRLELKTNRARDPGGATEDDHHCACGTSGLPPPEPLPPGQGQRREQAGKSPRWRPCANLVFPSRGDPLPPTEPEEGASKGVTSQGRSLLLGGAATGWSL